MLTDPWKLQEERKLWQKELAQRILNKTLLEIFNVFQLSSFNSMSHHPSNPTPPQQYPPHSILCALRTPEIGKCQLFHPCMGCPGVQNPHPFKTFQLIPTALNLLSWCCPHLGIRKSEKSRGVTSRFCSKDNMPEPLVQVIQPPAFLWSCPVSLFKDLQGIWVMFVWGYLLAGLSSSL